MFQIISLIAAFQALFFGVLVITKKNKSMFDKCISAWLLFLTAHILCISISQNVSIPYSNYFNYLACILSGLHGFFLYLCTSALVCNTQKDIKKEYIIIAGYILIAFAGFILKNSYLYITIVTRILAFLCNTLFIILAVRLFHRYKKFLQTNFSNIDMLSFNWMRLLAFGLIILLSGALILVILCEFFSFPISLFSVFAVMVLLFVNVLGFRGIKHSTIFNQTVPPYNQAQTGKQPTTDKEQASSYANYGLKQDDAISLSEKLKNYMEKEKPYTNMDLTLKDLASALDTYPHYITQVLNTVFNQNFYDFINTYRVEEVQKRLHDPQFRNFTILAVAYDCGFNSKSSFNRIFKQKTGLTPSEYRNR